MGNVCEAQFCDNTSIRENTRFSGMSQTKENISLKNLIQIKKASVTSEYCLSACPIGKGAFGSVFKATHKSSGLTRAVKRIYRSTNDSLGYVEEYLLLKKLQDHPNIIRIFDIFDQGRWIHIVMQFCQGGQLFQRIIKQQKITQNTAKLYMRQLLSAISNCHNNRIMHRDLKPENIMFLSPNSDDLKIIDFGAGTSYRRHQHTHLKVGSIYYMAPQVVRKQYNQKCDVWSLGVIMYTILVGTPPFNGKTDKQIYQKILDGKVQFNNQKWSKISAQAKHLVQQMLVYDPERRISAKKALHHAWLSSSSTAGDNNLYLHSQLHAIKSFCQLNSFQSAITTYISHHLLERNIMAELEKKFKAIDKNGDGKISWKQFKMCYVQNMPPLPDEEIQQIFNKLDKNHSGFIDYSQFIMSTTKKRYLESEDLFNKAFNMIDKDGDGYLSREELMYAFGGSSQDIYKNIMAEFDTNGDGNISRDEFIYAMKAFKKNIKYETTQEREIEKGKDNSSKIKQTNKNSIQSPIKYKTRQ